MGQSTPDDNYDEFQEELLNTKDGSHPHCRRPNGPLQGKSPPKTPPDSNTPPDNPTSPNPYPTSPPSTNPSRGDTPSQPFPVDFDPYVNGLQAGNAFASGASIEQPGAGNASGSGSIIVQGAISTQGPPQQHEVNAVGGRQVLQIQNGVLDLRWQFRHQFQTDNFAKARSFNPGGQSATFGFMEFLTSDIDMHYGGFFFSGKAGLAGTSTKWLQPGVPTDPRDPNTYRDLVNHTTYYKYKTYEATYYYYGGNNPVHYATNVNNQRGYGLYYNYDGAGRLNSISGDVGRLTPYFGYSDTAPTYYIQRMFLQDSVGNDHRATYYYYDANSAMQAIVEPENVVTYFLLAASPLGGSTAGYQVNRELDPDGYPTYMVYDSSQTSLIRSQWNTRVAYYQDPGQKVSSMQTSYPSIAAGPRLIQVSRQVRRVSPATPGFGNAVTNSLRGGKSINLNYDPVSFLPQIQADANNNGWAFQHHATSKLRTVIQGPSGDTTYYNYSTNGLNVLSKVEPRNQVTYYGYLPGEAALCDKILDPMGNAVYFGYDSRSRMQRKLDARGGVTYFAYDAYSANNVAVDALGNAAYFAFNANRRVTQKLDSLGRPSYYTYSKLDQLLAQQWPTGEISSYAVTKRGLYQAMARPGGRASYYQYDAYRNKTVDAQWNGSGFSAAYYQYDDQDNVVASTDPNGNVTLNGFDLAYQQTASLDALQNSTYFAYDPQGNLTQVQDARGNWTRQDYDSHNRRVVQARGVSGVPMPSQNLMAHWSFNEASGNASDDSGNGITLFNKQNVAYGAGVIANAAQFTIAGATYFSVADGTKLNPSDKIFIGCWAKMSVPVTSSYVLASKWRDGIIMPPYNAVYELYIGMNAGTSVPALYWRVLDSSDNSHMFTIDLPFDPMQWHHYAGVFDGTTGTFGIYLDGFFYPATNITVGTQIQTAYNAYFSVGCSYNQNTPWTFMNGAIDELFVYNSALNQATVSRLVQQRLSFNAGGDQSTVLATYYAYDLDGNRVISTDERNYSAYYGFDLLNRRVQSQDALGNATYFAYDPNNNQTQILNARNFATYYGYDALSRQVRSLDALGSASYFAYDGVGNQVASLTPGAQTAYYAYDGSDRQVIQVDGGGFATYFGFDIAGNMNRTLDPRLNATYFNSDLLDRRSSILDALSQQTYYQYDAASNRIAVMDRIQGASSAVSYFGYDALNRVIRQSDALSRPAYYQFDSVGNRIVIQTPGTPIHASYFQYDKFDRVNATLSPVGSSAYFAYDAASNRVQVLNPRRNAAYFAYDGLNRVSQSLDALSGAVYFVYDSVGNLIRRRDVRGFWTYFTFDALNRMTQTTDPNNGATIRGYDSAGNTSSVTPPAGSAAYFAYDKRNLSVASVDGAGDVTYFGYDASRNRTAVLSPRSFATYFAYDPLNRLSKLLDVVNGTAYFGYDIGGNVNRALDALSRPTYFAYDKLDRVTTVMDALNNSVYFGFDSAGNRAVEQDARLNTTYYQYDAGDRLSAVLDPLQKAAYYGYDANSNLAVTRDNIGAATYFGYDALDRRTVIGYAASSQYFAYDAAGNLTQVLDAWGASYFGYDSLNRLVARNTPRPDAAYYGYDAASNLLVLQYPQDNKACYYAYDGAQRMTKLLTPYGNAAYWNYDPSNDVPKKTYGNGMVSYASFDAMNRMSSLRYVTGAGATVTYFDYARDVAGRITKIARETDLAVYYSYDNVDRVLAETWRKKSNNAQIYAFTYNYDATGNRLTSRRETAGPSDYESTYYSYAADNSLAKKQIQNSALSTYYYYDANGSLTTSVEGTYATYFTYAASGLIASIMPPVSDGNAWNFSYDGQLNRYKIDKGGGVVSYLLWNGLNLMEERDGAGALVGRYTYGYSPIAGIGNCVEVYLASTAKTYAIAMDHRGTGHVLLDNTGAEIGRRYYDAFGVILGQTGTWPVALGYQSNWQTVQIGAKWWGLSAARVYDFATGQFNSRDPLPTLVKQVLAARRNVLGIYNSTKFEKIIFLSISYQRRLHTIANLYQYVKDSAVTLVDPSGLEICHEECTSALNIALKNDPRILELFKRIKTLNCKAPSINCTYLRQGSTARGETNGQTNNIWIYEANLNSASEVVQVIRHELNHAADTCLGLDLEDCNDAACSEVSSYSTSGQCDPGGYGYDKYGDTYTCVLMGTVFSLNGKCPGVKDDIIAVAKQTIKVCSVGISPSPSNPWSGIGADWSVNGSAGVF